MVAAQQKERQPAAEIDQGAPQVVHAIGRDPEAAGHRFGFVHGDRGQQLVSIGVAAVKGRLGDAGLSCNSFHRDRLRAVLEKHCPAGSENVSILARIYRPSRACLHHSVSIFDYDTCPFTKYTGTLAMNRTVLLLVVAVLAGCADQDDVPVRDSVRLVMTAPVREADPDSARLSGTVRARFETPVSFQVDGRILERLVDAGDGVESGEVLFRLDPRDFAQAVSVAGADLAAALAELETAAAETRRNRDLLAREFISEQVFERVQLAEKSARERADAARARLEQARNRLGYAELEAGHPGTLIEVTGEPGQVVAAGQPVGVIAQDGQSEVEVFLPERFGIPQAGRVVQGSRVLATLALREAAGAADDATRTWKARYTIVEGAAPLRLGAVVKVALDAGEASGGKGAGVLEVPVGAINERGNGPQVWVIRSGRAEPVRVSLLDVDDENARITADLEPGTQVIALGTHLLQSGMPVRALE